jgi:DNA-binding transcriptional ArsR family regulator
MADADVNRMSKVFRALSNKNRLQLFLNLLDESRLDLAKGRTHDCFLASIINNLRIGAPSISHHLRELEAAGLIATSKEGKQLVCSIRPDAMAEIARFFAAKSSA